MEINHIQIAFDTYSHITGLNTMSPIQRSETKKAFYMGVMALLDIMFRQLDKDPNSSEPTQADMNLMLEIHKELERFAADVVKGRI